MGGNFEFSKRGDEGRTSLYTGQRVSKSSLRPETYGTLDEATSALGLAKALSRNPKTHALIEAVQEDLLVLGSELACEGHQPAAGIRPENTHRLEGWIQELQEEVPLPRRFVHPGANPVSAAADLARTIVRRAERRAVALREAGLIDHPEVHAYLNRLGDFLFTLARYAEKNERGPTSSP